MARTVSHATAEEAGAVVERKCLRRARLHSYLTLQSPGCLVAMEACGSAHHWARLVLHLGHKILVMSPHKEAPYTNANKNDVNDADGIVEASSRPGMRFVGVKSFEQQHLQQVHRARQLALKERTAHCNQKQATAFSVFYFFNFMHG